MGVPDLITGRTMIVKGGESEREKRTGGRNNCESRQRGKQKTLFAKSGGASHNSTGCRDGVNCGLTTWKGHRQRDRDCKVFFDLWSGNHI